MRKLTLFFVLVACGDDSTDGHTDAGSGDGTQDAAFVCDPALQTGCAMGKACYSDLYLSSTGDPDYFCAPPGAGTQGVNCTADTDCAASFWCLKYVNPSGTEVRQCSAYCRTTPPTHGCPGPQLCVESMDAPFGYCI